MAGSSYYNKVFPNNARQQLDGGLNTKFERSLIADNESPDCYNVVFGDGAVGTRGGSSRVNTAAIGSFVFDGLYTKHDNGTSAETMVAFAGGSMWQLAGTSFSTVASAQSVFTAGNRVSTAEYQNKMFIGNGGVTPYKYDGTYFTRHGVPAASGTFTLTSNAGGIAAGVYGYKITYMNSFSVEGDVGAAISITLSASGNVAITNIPVAPTSHGVSARRIYRTAVGGSEYKRVTTISDNTTTSYTDSTTDANLGATAPTDQGEPPKYSVVCFHQNRLFCNDPTNRNYIWWSELGEPYTFKVTSFLRIGDNTGDLLYTIHVYQNNLILGCQNSSWLLYMPSTDPTEWSLIRIASPFGSKSPFCGFQFDNRFMTAAIENSKFVGFAAISGTSVDPSASVLDTMIAGGTLYSDKIQTDMLDGVNSLVGNFSSVVYKNKGFIAITKSSSSTTNNVIYVFDFSLSNLARQQRFSWSRYSGLAAAQFTVYNGNLYYGSSTATGFVYQMETSNYADVLGSTAINSYFWTKEFSGLPGHENLVKDFRKLFVLVDMPGAYNMDVSYRLDSDNSDGFTIPIDLTPNAAVWGSFFWGNANYGAGSLQSEAEVSLGSASGKRIQFKFSNQNTVNQRFKIHSIKLVYNIRGVT
jgi:hypothetical protein